MSLLWSRYTAAPHRVMFLPGAIYGVVAMAWWVFELEARYLGVTGLAPTGVAPAALHLWSLLYGFFPFFVFGFLFTAMPNWLDAPAIGRANYVSAGLALAAGVGLVYGGLWWPPLLTIGLVLHLAGWLVACAALIGTLRRAPPQDKRHAAVATLAVVLGGLGAAAFLADWLGRAPSALTSAESLAIWGFLTPLFLVVCHRMIPWFTGRVVAHYLMIRPWPPLWLALTAALGHGLLQALGRQAWAWPLDLVLALVVLWFAAQWGVARGVQQVRLLAMLHIAWLWAGFAFALYAADGLAAFLAPAWRTGLAPLHALAIGFFSTMLIAMASRVSLGHSGRKLEADGLTWTLFWLVQASALTRMLPELAPATSSVFTRLAGYLWLLAFGAWAWRYAPMYWRARVDGRPG
jgi:uncharacterized protein involved in response to NO